MKDTPILQIKKLSKSYASGFQALTDVDLEIRRGEIFALLGPNGAGKTTLISIICGIVNPSSGQVLADGHDIVKDYRKARETIGLVPQELTNDVFETVWNSVKFSRGLFGKPSNPKHLEDVLKELSLWDKRSSKFMALSGGMKRRVMIAKALAHEPLILFLDEPTAGVDVELRREMWKMVRRLRENGVTVILTTHYIEEAQEMADRVAVINKGKIILVEDKDSLMRKMGKKKVEITLSEPVPDRDVLDLPGVEWNTDGRVLTYAFDGQSEDNPVPDLIRRLDKHGLKLQDIRTEESSLEDIFVDLVKEKKA